MRTVRGPAFVLRRQLIVVTEETAQQITLNIVGSIGEHPRDLPFLLQSSMSHADLGSLTMTGMKILS